jgi:hypothetical protein
VVLHRYGWMQPALPVVTLPCQLQEGSVWAVLLVLLVVLMLAHPPNAEMSYTAGMLLASANLVFAMDARAVLQKGCYLLLLLVTRQWYCRPWMHAWAMLTVQVECTTLCSEVINPCCASTCCCMEAEVLCSCVCLLQCHRLL